MKSAVLDVLSLVLLIGPIDLLLVPPVYMQQQTSIKFSEG
jgi:hypothetical protein